MTASRTTFTTSYRIPGRLTASGRPLLGSLTGPYPSAEAAIADATKRHPTADRITTTRHDDEGEA